MPLELEMQLFSRIKALKHAAALTVCLKPLAWGGGDLPGISPFSPVRVRRHPQHRPSLRVVEARDHTQLQHEGSILLHVGDCAVTKRALRLEQSGNHGTGVYIGHPQCLFGPIATQSSRIVEKKWESCQEMSPEEC